MNSPATEGPKRQFTVSTITGVFILLLAVTLLFIFFGAVCRPPHVMSKKLICKQNFRVLFLYVSLYANDNTGQYPPAERWCDALVESISDLEPKRFRCPGVETGPCNYAMNPNADPNDPGEVVLLFESEPGWNRFGGPELLTPGNHKNQGCCVLFVDGRVEFIESDRIDDLKWTGQDRDIQGF